MIKALLLFALCASSFAASIRRVQSSQVETPATSDEPVGNLSTTALMDRPGLLQYRTHSPRLDEIACSHEYGPIDITDSVTWPFAEGSSIAFWVRSGGCPQCEIAEAVRVETVSAVFVRPDNSAIDTLLVEIAVHCAETESDSCSGLGSLRGTRQLLIPFEADPFDGVNQITIPIVSFSGILIDSLGGFVVLTNLGFSGGSTEVAISTDERNEFPLADCQVFAGSNELADWNQIWADSVGGPRAQILSYCDLDDTTSVPFCAENCTMTRFTGPQAYFDPFTNIVYQWIDPAPGVLPFVPQRLDLNIYFESVGNSTDRAYFRVLFACPGFGGTCCPPGEPLCTVSASAERGTPFQTVLNVVVPLDGADCCLSDPFWLGVIIDSVTNGATLPSFLFSAQDVDPNPPLICEQWSGANGGLLPIREDEAGWADMSLNSLCGSCMESHAVSCSPEPQLLDCNTYVVIACVEDGLQLEDQTITFGQGNASRYCCSDLYFPGMEMIYAMQIPNQGNLSIRAQLDTTVHVAFFLLESCNAQNCIAFGIDSLFATSLTNGLYYIVVEPFDTMGLTMGLNFSCIADCNSNPCIEDLQGPGGIGNRYLDSEGDGSGTQFYQSYYPGSGSTQTILRFDAERCDSLASIAWLSVENAPSRMLAYDPRNGGEFWCGTTSDFFTGAGRLYRISSGGGVIQSWSVLSGLPIMRWSGAAFDPTHNHLWVFVRDSSNTGNSRAFEIDVSNPQLPLVIQGPHLLPHLSPNESFSCAGADYAHLANHLLVVHQGSPDDFVQCYEDIDPAYAGPRPGPGFTPLAWCAPDSNSLQGYGLAAVEDSFGGKIMMTNFTDSDWVHPFRSYPPPCRLTPTRCLAPNNLTVFAGESAAVLTWTSIYPGTYFVYSSVSPNNDGDPDGGLDPLFTLETSMQLAAGPAQWSDTGELADFKVYAIVFSCSTSAE